VSDGQRDDLHEVDDEDEADGEAVEQVALAQRRLGARRLARPQRRERQPRAARAKEREQRDSQRHRDGVGREVVTCERGDGGSDDAAVASAGGKDHGEGRAMRENLELD